MLISFLFLIFTYLAWVVVNCSMQHGFIDSLNNGVKFLRKTVVLRRREIITG